MTAQQLDVLFLKCITPGATIVVGSIGGSITAGGGRGVGDAAVYTHRIATSLAIMCPRATVTSVNAARGGTGSLTTAMCLSTLLGPHIDLLAMEFALNDWEQYSVDRVFSAAPFELLVRSALTHFQHAPALYAIYFWGQNFRHESAQEDHHTVATHYDITGISMRDVAWKGLEFGEGLYKSRDTVLADARHHPNAAVHSHLADIVTLHLTQRFSEWAKAAQAAHAAATPVPGRGAPVLLPPPSLPAPLADAELSRFDVVNHTFRCEMLGTPRAGSRPGLYEAEGWEPYAMGSRSAIRLDSQECIQASRQDARAILDGEFH